MKKAEVQIIYANQDLLETWMELVERVRYEIPGLSTDQLLEGHKKTVLKNMKRESAICAQLNGKVVGVLLFSTKNNMLSFLAVHPDYRRRNIATIMIREMFHNLDRTKNIEVDTFGEGDPAGKAARAFYKKIGFVEGKLIPWRSGTIINEYAQQRFIYGEKSR